MTRSLFYVRACVNLVDEALTLTVPVVALVEKGVDPSIDLDYSLRDSEVGVPVERVGNNITHFTECVLKLAYNALRLKNFPGNPRNKDLLRRGSEGGSIQKERLLDSLVLNPGVAPERC